MKKTAILCSLLLVLALVLAGCNSNSSSAGADGNAEATETTFERAQREGYISVGFANESPFAYATPDGKLTGLNVEIARLVLQRMGIEEMQGVLTEFGSLIPGLKAGRFDVITAGMYITPDRAEQVAFANPEYTIGGGLAVKAGNPYDLHSYKDIAANPEVKIAVMAGAAEFDHLTAVGVSEEQITTVPDQPSALAALQAGRVDAITMTSAALQSLMDTIDDPNIERVEDFTIAVVDGKSQQAFGSAAFRPEDNDFREAYNAELDKLKESGELLEIYQSFGFTEHELPGEVTAEEALEMW
ncbi:ectoine/hydroxyectoine ABC transporter substrate-binding protein EhuB [Desulfallas thermosapovorans]|uniref:Polar amino acid transport system substrate-binding protein n=1 Tax=Desulfallas thermosapovorans DSM 6562 TaxID=1121431 RepID=A0A5S4ZNR1_9FIRM|nr:ectoine/hydroxyectoine ABC transporter substrate-binding protein EhuB [Desulfallas thermosapovorans]TYO93907.1 polar amino acid transport system substrate-binding protein [Desulfallas thermosapovorans DSM 6562]